MTQFSAKIEHKLGAPMAVLQKVSAPNAWVPLLLCPNGCAPKSQCPKCLGAPITVPQSTVLLRLCSKRSAPRSSFQNLDYSSKLEGKFQISPLKMKRFFAKL